MGLNKRVQLLAIVLLATVVVSSFGRDASSAETQDVSSLDRRISMIEQRFYTLETSINRLQQYVTSQRSTSSSPSSDGRDRDVEQLRQEMQRLQLRLSEVECGLLKLDERTVSAPGNRRSGEARPADPCRHNPSVPLRLPSRP